MNWWQKGMCAPIDTMGKIKREGKCSLFKERNLCFICCFLMSYDTI